MRLTKHRWFGAGAKVTVVLVITTVVSVLVFGYRRSPPSSGLAVDTILANASIAGQPVSVCYYLYEDYPDSAVYCWLTFDRRPEIFSELENRDRIDSNLMWYIESRWRSSGDFTGAYRDIRGINEVHVALYKNGSRWECFVLIEGRTQNLDSYLLWYIRDKSRNWDFFPGQARTYEYR